MKIVLGQNMGKGDLSWHPCGTNRVLSEWDLEKGDRSL